MSEREPCQWCHLPLIGAHVGMITTVSIPKSLPPECGAQRGVGETCSREPGHDGEHVACGLAFHDCARWLDD